MGAHSTDRFRATAAPSIGSSWENVPYIYDGDFSTYAQRYSSSTSASHINGFGISLPDNATVTSLEVHSRLYASSYIGSDYGYIWVYVYTDEGPTSVFGTEIVNGSDLSISDHKQVHTAEQIKSVLDSKGLCNGDIMQFLKTLRVRFVMGSTNTAPYRTTCRVYDNYVVVNYTIPDITYTYVNYDGSVLKTETVEEGTDPTPPSDPTRPSTAKYKYTFSGWELSGTTYTAQYTATTRSYTISTAVTPEGAGTVTGGGSGKYGTTKTLTATANDGYVFTGWSDGDTTNPRTVTIKKKATYTAQFEEVQTSKLHFGADKAKSMFDEQKNKAKSVWYGKTQIL